jgi:hypothetical protein
VARLYKVEGESGGGCPGESECEIWLSSAEDSPVRCPSCPKRVVSRSQEAESSERESEPEAFDERSLLDRVERFRQERNAGRHVYEWMAPIEWEAMLIWDETEAQYRRGHEIRIEQVFQMMMASMTR